MRGGDQSKLFDNLASGKNTGREAPSSTFNSGQIHWLKTLIHNKSIPDNQSDLIYKQHKNQINLNQVIVWDTSASTLRNQAASKAKGIILRFFEQAYLKRQRIGLLEFSANEVRVVTACDRVNRELITPKIQALTIGGNTPIEKAIKEAISMLKLAQKKQPDSLSKLILITDGLFQEIPAKPSFESQYLIIDINIAVVNVGACERMANQWDADIIKVVDQS